MNLIISETQESAITLEGCRYCLMCRHVCPVGRVTNCETTTPHGWALMIVSVKDALLEWDADTVDKLYQCAQCGVCQASCVLEQPLPAAIAMARGEVVDQHLAPAAVYALDDALRRWGNPYVESEPERPSRTGKVALFVGDAAYHLRPAEVEAAGKLLKSVDIEPVLVGAGRSTGQLAFALGLIETARQMARATLEDVLSVDCKQLLTLSPGDYYTFTTLYPVHLGVVWPDDVEIVDLVTLLAEYLEGRKLRLNEKTIDAPFTYHDPCHTPRVPGRGRLSRKLLIAATGQQPLEMLWRDDRATPCGAISGLNFTHPGLSEKLTSQCLAEITEIGAQIAITEDPACLTQLARYADGSDMSVRSLLELLAERGN